MKTLPTAIILRIHGGLRVTCECKLRKFSMTMKSYWVRSLFLQDQSAVSQVTLTEHTERACYLPVLLPEMHKSNLACVRKLTLPTGSTSTKLLLVSLISSNHSLTHSDGAWHSHQSYNVACGPLSNTSPYRTLFVKIRAGDTAFCI